MKDLRSKRGGSGGGPIGNVYSKEEVGSIIL